MQAVKKWLKVRFYNRLPLATVESLLGSLALELPFVEDKDSAMLEFNAMIGSIKQRTK